MYHTLVDSKQTTIQTQYLCTEKPSSFQLKISRWILFYRSKKDELLPHSDPSWWPLSCRLRLFGRCAVRSICTGRRICRWQTLARDSHSCIRSYSIFHCAYHLNLNKKLRRKCSSQHTRYQTLLVISVTLFLVSTNAEVRFPIIPNIPTINVKMAIQSSMSIRIGRNLSVCQGSLHVMHGWNAKVESFWLLL